MELKEFVTPGVLVVTGGSRGIGAATATLGAAAGYAVAVNYATDEAAAQRVVDGIRASGGRATAIHADVAREQDIVQLFERAEAELGPIGALVNNAGITGGFARVDELTAEQLEAVMRINVIAPFLCAREAIRRMSTKSGGRGGAIVNVSSRAARIGSAGEYVHYAASKGALETFTLGLAREVANEGIRVNAVAPGLIDTEIHARGGKPDRMRQLGPGVPIGRAGTAEEVAAAIAWLLSPAASYVAGAIIDVAGGR